MCYTCVTERAHVFKESPENITVQEGEVARLSCLMDSVPFPPNITWQHNETLLSYHNESKYILVPPGVLYISATKLSDAGSYRYITTVVTFHHKVYKLLYYICI